MVATPKSEAYLITPPNAPVSLSMVRPVLLGSTIDHTPSASMLSLAVKGLYIHGASIPDTQYILSALRIIVRVSNCADISTLPLTTSSSGTPCHAMNV